MRLGRTQTAPGGRRDRGNADVDPSDTASPQQPRSRGTRLLQNLSQGGQRNRTKRLSMTNPFRHRCRLHDHDPSTPQEEEPWFTSIRCGNSPPLLLLSQRSMILASDPYCTRTVLHHIILLDMYIPCSLARCNNTSIFLSCNVTTTLNPRPQRRKHQS
jgi:hypothetical protein